MSTNLYNKWRPRHFNDFVGQVPVVRILQSMIIHNHLRSAYLLYGMHGSGKTSIARVFAHAINCTHPNPQVRPCGQCQNCAKQNIDIIEIDAATNTGIDDVRSLRERIMYLPESGQKRIYIIDEVHRFSGSAFDALLKMIEEPPPHIIFMLATTELDKVPQTIKSRCVLIQFQKSSVEEIQLHLSNIAEVEGISIDQQGLHIIATEAKGSMRDGIKLFDQMVISPNIPIKTSDIQVFTGMINRETVKRILYSIINGRTLELIEDIRKASDSGAIPSKLAQQISEAAHSKLIHSLNNGESNKYEMLSHITSVFADLVRNSEKVIETIDIEIAAMQIAIKNKRVLNYHSFVEIWSSGEFERVLSKRTNSAAMLTSYCTPYSYNMANELTVAVAEARLAETLRQPERKAVFEDVLKEITGEKIKIIISG